MTAAEIITEWERLRGIAWGMDLQVDLCTDDPDFAFIVRPYDSPIVVPDEDGPEWERGLADLAAVDAYLKGYEDGAS